VPAGVLLVLPIALVPAPPVTTAPAEIATEYGWSAPTECPDAEHVAATIEHYAARPLARTGNVLRSAKGTIESDGTGYRLLLEMDVAQGVPVQRVLRDPSCEVLAETAALMIAVTIDPAAATRAALPREPTPPPVEPTPEPTPPVAQPREATTTTRSTTRDCNAGRSRLRVSPRDLRPCVGLEARAGMQLGLLPEIIAGGVGGDLAITWPRLRLELGGTHWFARPARVAGDPPRGGDLSLSVGSLGLCARFGRRRVEGQVCGGGELGAMVGRGVGIDEPRTERVLWGAAWVGPRVLGVVHPRVVLLGGVDLVVPLARYRFEVDGLGVVHRVDPVGGRFRLGVGVRL
jgi:hypothetical protein